MNVCEYRRDQSRKPARQLKDLPERERLLSQPKILRMAGLIQEYLLKTGYDVVCELNLDAALEALIGTRFDLLIVDGEMPEKVLREFVEIARRAKPGLQIIAVGMSDHETESKALSGFVSAFIEKPFSISDISRTIKEIQTQSPAISFGDASLKTN